MMLRAQRFLHFIRMVIVTAKGYSTDHCQSCRQAPSMQCMLYAANTFMGRTPLMKDARQNSILLRSGSCSAIFPKGQPPVS